jgi:hypothetical protein
MLDFYFQLYKKYIVRFHVQVILDRKAINNDFSYKR